MLNVLHHTIIVSMQVFLLNAWKMMPCMLLAVIASATILAILATFLSTSSDRHTLNNSSDALVATTRVVPRPVNGANACSHTKETKKSTQYVHAPQLQQQR